MAGTVLEQFENEFADWLGVERAWAFWKGRFAMYAILRAWGIGEGDEVIIPGYTCISAVRAVKFVGAKVVYVDIEPGTYNMDVSQLEEKVTANTRLIVGQHTYGYPCEMDAIKDVAARHNLLVLEDSCHAMGSTYKGTPTGRIVPYAYFSSQWTKCFPTGMGGILTCDDTNLAEKIDRVVRDECREPGLKESAVLTVLRWVHRCVAFPRTMLLIQRPYRWLSEKGFIAVNPPGTKQVTFDPAQFKRMGAGQARQGRRYVGRLDRDIEHRKRLQRLYTELLRDRGWPLPQIPDHIDPVLVRFPVRVRDKQRCVAEAQRRLLEVGTWFDKPLHQITVPMAWFDYEEGSCPVSERVVDEIVNLPTHARTSEKMARQVVDLVCEIGPAC